MKERGLSLVEIIIMVAVSTLIVTGVFSIYISSQKNFAKQESISRMHQETRITINLIGKKLKHIDNILSLDCTPGASSISFTGIEEMGTATSGTASSLTNTTKNWTADNWINHEVVIQEGASSGDIRTICSNTTDTLLVSAAGCGNNWTSLPNTTSYYVVRSSGVFAIDLASEKINYTVNGVTEIALSPMTELSFQGYDATGTVSCDPAQVKSIEISAKGRNDYLEQKSGSYRYYSVKTTVQMRNLR